VRRGGRKPESAGQSPAPDADLTAGDGSRAPSDVSWQAVVEHIPAITYTQVEDPSSPTGFRDEYISPQTEQMLGYTAEEWKNDPELWITTTHAADLAHVLDAEADAVAFGRPFHSEYRMIAKNGDVRWFRDEAALVVDAEAGTRTWQGLMLDITELKQTEQRLRDAELRYRTLVETIPAIVFIDENDDDATNIYTSPQSQRILGYTPDDWANTPGLWWNIIHPDDLERVREANERHAREGGLFDERYRVIARSGNVVWVRDLADTFDDGEKVYSLGMFLDITDQKEAEEALARAHEDRSAMLHRLILSEEEERGSIARSLDESALQVITTLLVRLNALRRPDLDKDVLDGLHVLQDAVQEAVVQLRTLLFQLRPPGLERGGMESGLQQYLRATLEGTDVDWSIQDMMITQPSAGARVVGFRILQQAIGHLREQFEPARIAIALHTRQEGLSVSLDYAGGSDFRSDHEPMLRELRERAESTGGWLRGFVLGRSVRIEFWLPG
jgi:PAS domain S-box-containing protein